MQPFDLVAGSCSNRAGSDKETRRAPLRRAPVISGAIHFHGVFHRELRRYWTRPARAGAGRVIQRALRFLPAESPR